MKVKELIELLKTADQNLEVQTEGCDCYGEVGGIEIVNPNNSYRVNPIEPYLLITRPNEKETS